MKKTLGGERIGSGNKMQFNTKHFNRSTHDLSTIFRTTMSAGTLVPFYVIPTLPGDTHDIRLNCMTRTLPAIGPLFGSAKVQLDMYQVVMRQYNRDLQMNKLELGRDIAQVQFPQVEVQGNDIYPSITTENTKETPWGGKEVANCQIEPSTLFSYLGMKGIGYSDDATRGIVKRQYLATTWLAYWDIVKNYYANKQEADAYVIHNRMLKQDQLTYERYYITDNNTNSFTMNTSFLVSSITQQMVFILRFQNYENYNAFLEDEIEVKYEFTFGSEPVIDYWRAQDFNIQRRDSSLEIYFNLKTEFIPNNEIDTEITFYSKIDYDYTRPNLSRFELKNIDIMRENIMSKSGDTPMLIDKDLDLEPYNLILQTISDVGEDNIFDITALQCKQEGLALKTYQSDINNNFLNSEWISGSNGVNEVTAIQTDENGRFTLDEFNIKKKVYDMLNHVMASGGAYDDWQEVVYGVERVKQINSPMYEGGLSKELIFEEVVSQSASDSYGEQALGTLAGRGVMSEKHKGGSMVIKCTEPGFIIGIVSITPRIDYSTGNEWFTNLKNMSELHNPYLDAIAYQDLMTDTLGFWETKIDINGNDTAKSVGKQPAWMNYQTATNKVYGNFALENEQMFMVFNRKYEVEPAGANTYRIGDVTTYIDPTKYNHIFADASPDAMNYWVQISIEDECRRVMSANQIPNL